MTKEEAKKQLIWYFDNDDGLGADLKTRQAYMKAIEALEQKPKYCDRNICTSNEYNGIRCEECEVTKSQKRILEPCEDAVSRKFMCELGATCIATRDKNGKLIALGAIEALPPVTPIHTETVTEFADRCRECGARYGRLLKHKKGKWINKSQKSGCGITCIASECTCCGKKTFFNCDELIYRFCPNCGAEMESEK